MPQCFHIEKALFHKPHGFLGDGHGAGDSAASEHDRRSLPINEEIGWTENVEYPEKRSGN